jgi:hypothetical protein
MQFFIVFLLGTITLVSIRFQFESLETLQYLMTVKMIAQVLSCIVSLHARFTMSLPHIMDEHGALPLGSRNIGGAPHAYESSLQALPPATTCDTTLHHLTTGHVYA